MLIPAINPFPPASVSYTDSTYSTSGLSTYTFSGRAIGTASSSRYIVVGTGNWQTAARTITSVTVAGNTMTELMQISATGTNQSTSGLFIYRLTAGTTADIVVTLSGASQGCSIGVWAVYDLLSTTPTDTLTASQVGSPYYVTGSIDYPADGVVIGFSHFVTASSPSTVAWTGPTESFDIQGGIANSECSGAAKRITVSAAAQTVTATPSVGTFTGTLAVAALR